MEIAVFGGTFDPVHEGHCAVADGLLKLGGCGRVLVLPSYDPPHKPGRCVASFDDRLRMLELAFAGHDNVVVSPLERDFGFSPSYTVEVMAVLAEHFPGDSLKLVLGGDSLRDFHLWHRAAELAERYDFLIYPRPGETPTLEDLLKNWDGETARKLHGQLLDLPFFEISSTILRKKMEKGENTANFIPERVREYIEQKNLYRIM